MSTLCRITKAQAAWIWNELRTARQFQSKVGEESITDFLVLQWHRFCDGSYSVRSFNRREEATTGADWELWFTGASGKWFGLRVQAKIISITRKWRYPQLHYKNQTQALIADAKKHGATPLYCLYSYWQSPEAGSLPWPCGSMSATWPLMGASLLSVQRVQALKAGNDNSLLSVAPDLTPWHCLFCCQHSGSGDLPTRAAAFARSKVYGGENEPELRDEPPPHVAALLRTRDGLVGGESDSRELDGEDENLRGVTIITDRQPPQTGETTRIHPGAG
jgi:hypothetical protein